MNLLSFIIMLPMRLIIWLYKALWSYISGAFEGGFRTAIARLMLALMSAFLLIGIPFYIAGLVFDFDGFAVIDGWLDRQGGQIETAGDWVFRLGSGLVLAICAVGVALVIRDQIAGWRRTSDKQLINLPDPNAFTEEAKPLGCGCLTVSIVVGYFAWFGMAAPT